MTRIRIDKQLVELGLAPSRERARALIMAGKVLVDDAPVTKAGTLVDEGATVRLRGADHPYVSRGALKLQGALDAWPVEIRGKIILDVGASTGGFTDLCLRRGAAKVYAVDVGTNQLDYRLRTDARVHCLEQTNARYLAPDQLPGKADLATIDVSFISLTQILPAVATCLERDSGIIALVKPQFEAGRENVGKGGVVKDDAVRQQAVQKVVDCAVTVGFAPRGQIDSPIAGPKGNREIFVHLVRTSSAAPT